MDILSINWQLVVPPFTLAFLGWVTNWIAIKMLFYPKKPRFGIQGIFPKHRDEFAIKTGDLMAKILDPSEVMNSLSQSEFYEKVYEQLSEAMDQRWLTFFIGERKRRKMFEEVWEYIENQFVNTPDMSGSVQKFAHDYVLTLDTDDTFKLFDNYIGEHIYYLTWFGALIGFVIGLIQSGLTFLW